LYFEELFFKNRDVILEENLRSTPSCPFHLYIYLLFMQDHIGFRNCIHFSSPTPSQHPLITPSPSRLSEPTTKVVPRYIVEAGQTEIVKLAGHRSQKMKMREGEIETEIEREREMSSCLPVLSLGDIRSIYMYNPSD
jgi:hypothetical protein